MHGAQKSWTKCPQPSPSFSSQTWYSDRSSCPCSSRNLDSGTNMCVLRFMAQMEPAEVEEPRPASNRDQHHHVHQACACAPGTLLFPSSRSQLQSQATISAGASYSNLWEAGSRKSGLKAVVQADEAVPWLFPASRTASHRKKDTHLTLPQWHWPVCRSSSASCVLPAAACVCAMLVQLCRKPLWTVAGTSPELFRAAGPGNYAQVRQGPAGYILYNASASLRLNDAHASTPHPPMPHCFMRPDPQASHLISSCVVHM